MIPAIILVTIALFLVMYGIIMGIDAQDEERDLDIFGEENGNDKQRDFRPAEIFRHDR